MNERSLRLQGIAIKLDGRPLLQLDVVIGAGEVLTVMGASGTGKATLLAYIAGFIEPAFTASGRIIADGHDVTEMPPERRRIGLLFQDPMLFPHLSVAGNLLFGLPAGATDRRARMDAALASAGLDGYGRRDPATLSGGEAARVALLRVLLSEPCALLLDEPFGKLDQERRVEIREFTFANIRARGLPTLLVTHDPEDARAAGGRIVSLDLQ